MAQSIAGTHLAETWAASSRVVAAKVEVQWDGANWTDETGRVLDVEIAASLYDRQTGLPGLGRTQPATALLTLDNHDNRYSWRNAASPLHTYIANGIYRVPVRISLGYTYNGTPELLRQFTGEIEVPRDWEETGAQTVQFACVDASLPALQHKHSTTVFQNQRPDQIIASLLDEVGLTDRALDRALSIIPWAWLDDENIWPECQRLAEADGGALYVAKDGQVRYERMTHWLEGSDHTAPVVTLDRGKAWYIDDAFSWRDCYTGVIVEYAPRYLGTLSDLYVALDAIEVPPASSVEQTCRYRYPAYSIITPVNQMDYQAVTPGMVDMHTDLTITLTAYAQHAHVEFANSNAYQTIYVLNFKLRGVPLYGDEAQEVKRTSDLGLLPGTKEYPASGNPYLQEPLQAQRLANFLRDRLERPRNLIGWRGAACPWLELGDRVHVHDANRSIDEDCYILSMAQRWSAGAAYEMELGLLPCTNLFAYTDYFTLGVSSWGDPSARAFY